MGDESVRHITIWLDDVSPAEAGEVKTAVLDLLAEKGLGMPRRRWAGRVKAVVFAGPRKEPGRVPCNEENGFDREAGLQNAHVSRRHLAALGLTVPGTTRTLPCLEEPHVADETGTDE